MRFSFKSLGLAAAAATLSLSTVACHGQYPSGSGYMPTDTTPLSASQGIEPLHKKGEIQSGCGHHMNVIIAGIVDCRFREKGYTGTFTIDNRERGIVGVSPSSGTQDTTFTIVGLVSGNGYFLVRDTTGNKYKIAVTVSL